MVQVDKLIERVKETRRGFLDIQKAAEEIFEIEAIDSCVDVALSLLKSEIHQARMLSTFLFGLSASKSDECLVTLREKVSCDQDWRVQEILAKAFDRYCSDIGYESSLPVIKSWLADQNPNVRRAVSEGLRIWTNRPYFDKNPGEAIRLLSNHKADESEYVRKSVGNALRDISKKHPLLIQNELKNWDTSNKHIKQTYKLAVKFINN